MRRAPSGLTAAILRIANGRTVLDLGLGGGMMCVLRPPFGVCVIGIDPRPSRTIVGTDQGGAMAFAFVQEFAIVGDDTSTANYDAISAELALGGVPDGGIVHTAGFDHERGVFRIFEVWESREVGQRFIDERVVPLVQKRVGEVGEDALRPPTAEYWYELHDVMA
jgi:hypothetical protein